MPRLPRPALGCKGYPGPARRALVIGHVSDRQLGAARASPPGRGKVPAQGLGRGKVPAQGRACFLTQRLGGHA